MRVRQHDQFIYAKRFYVSLLEVISLSAGLLVEVRSSISEFFHTPQKRQLFESCYCWSPSSRLINDGFFCISCVVEGVAVGCGWQTWVAYINLGCCYIVGLPLGCLLGFRFNLGITVRIITPSIHHYQEFSMI